MLITIKELIESLQEYSTNDNQQVILSNRDCYKYMIDGFGISDQGEFVIDIIATRKKMKYENKKT